MKKLNPLSITLLWLLFSVLLTLVVMIYLGVTTSGGEQKPLIFLSKFIYAIVYGVLVLSIMTIPFYKEWSRKYWIFHFLLIGACCTLIFFGIQNSNSSEEYPVSRIDTVIGGKKYTKIIEYYKNRSNIRLVAFTYQNKKDSIWVVYSQKGDIVSRVRYSNDSLIEVLK